jgi:hypothetical protein
MVSKTSGARCGDSHAPDTRVSMMRALPRRTLSVTSLLFIATSCLAQAQTSPALARTALESRQQPEDLPSPHDRVSPAQSQRQKAEEQIKIEEKQRILGMVPQFNVSNIADAVRLTPGQKFELAFKSSFDPFTFVFAGLSSGISQAENSFSGYGQGMEGYAKRFAASYVDSFDGTMIGNAMLPIVLHQDPRYFRKATGGVASRIGYAVMTTFLCKGDSGHWQPNFSNLLGNFAAGGISDLYYPAGDRGLVNTYQRAIVVSAEGALGAIGSEFWPDIAHHFRKKHQAGRDQP